MEQQYGLLWYTHVMLEKGQRSMQGSAKGLGNVKGQDMIFLSPTLKPVLEDRRSGSGTKHHPKLPIRCHSLLGETRHKSRYEWGMSILMSCYPCAIGLYAPESLVPDPLGINHIMASCQASERMAPYACTKSSCTG